MVFLATLSSILLKIDKRLTIRWDLDDYWEWGIKSCYVRQARPFFPLMFIEHDPQIPSRHERRKVSVGSCSFLILMSASKTIIPQSLRSTSYSFKCGLSPGFSGSYLLLLINYELLLYGDLVNRVAYPSVDGEFLVAWILLERLSLRGGGGSCEFHNRFRLERLQAYLQERRHCGCFC